MRNTKYIELLKTLSPEELSDYRKYLTSAYLNKNEKCLEFLDLLLKFAPDFNDKQLEGFAYFEAVYSNKNSLTALIRKMMGLLESFFIQIELEELRGFNGFLLMRQLLRRKNFKHFKTVYERTVIYFKNKQRKSLYDYSCQFLIEAEYFQYQFDTREDKPYVYDKLLFNLDTSYLCRRLKYTSSMVTLQRIGETLDVPSSELMLQLVNEKRMSEVPLVKLYSTALKLIVEVQEEDYLEMLDLLEKYASILPRKEAAALYTTTINYCVQKLTEGKDYYKRLLEIYKICIDGNFFMIDNRLTPERLLNLVIVGAYAKDFEWLEQFLIDNETYVEKSFRKIVLCYCRGVLYFHQGKYSLASSSLIKANSESTPKNSNQDPTVKSLKFNIQELLLKTHYKEKNRATFPVQAKAFLERLRNAKKINSKEIEGYRNFIRMIKTLFKKLTDPNFDNSIDELKEKLNSFENIGSKQWLLNEIDLLGED